ncbi:MAG: hypothetical protein ACHBN1_21900 [Heteroscytonema crispum UTEX LB 1556]
MKSSELLNTIPTQNFHLNLHAQRIELNESSSQEAFPQQQSQPIETVMPMGGMLLIYIACLIMPWMLFLMARSAVWKVVYTKMFNIKSLQKIPCYKCKFFEHNAYLQCAVNPCQVLTPEATNCLDYSPKSNAF